MSGCPINERLCSCVFSDLVSALPTFAELNSCDDLERLDLSLSESS